MPACVMNWGCNHTETGAADGMCGAMFRAFVQAKKKIVVDPRRIGLAKAPTTGSSSGPEVNARWPSP